MLIAAFFPISLLSTTDNAIYSEAKVVIHMSHVIFIFFICRLGAALAVLTPVSGQVFSYLSWSFSVSEAGSLTPKRLHHLPIDVRHRYGRLPTMPFFVSEPGAIPSNHDQLLGAPLSENAVRCTRNSTLFFSIKGL